MFLFNFVLIFNHENKRHQNDEFALSVYNFKHQNNKKKKVLFTIFKSIFKQMLRRLIFGSSVIAGLSSAAIHRSWVNYDTFDDIYSQPAGKNLGGTGTTYYNFDGKTNENAAIRPPLATNIASNAENPLIYDACVIGGGFAGLHVALSLAEKGKKVVVLEGKRIGCGASGRNGGDALIGFHMDMEELEYWLGGNTEKAKELFSHSEAAYYRLKNDIIPKYRIACNAQEHGAVTLSFASEKAGKLLAGADKEKKVEEARAEVAAYNETYKQKIEFKSKQDLEKMGFHSDRYECGYYEPRNMTLDPLDLSLGLARACETNGAKIYENSKVLSVGKDLKNNFVVSTSLGAVRAKHCVLCTNHCPANISKKLAIRSTPISTCMMLTAPIPKEKLDKCIKMDCAVFDDRFGLAYFRRVPGDRMVYGCFASGLPIKQSGDPEKRRRQELTDDLVKTFPILKDDIRPERFWSGRLQCQFPVFPLVGKDEDTGMYYSLAFAGHGLVPTCAAGTVLADAICEGDRRYELWGEVVPKWLPSGGPWGYLGATVACQGLRIYDKIKGRA